MARLRKIMIRLFIMINIATCDIIFKCKSNRFFEKKWFLGETDYFVFFRAGKYERQQRVGAGASPAPTNVAITLIRTRT